MYDAGRNMTPWAVVPAPADDVHDQQLTDESDAYVGVTGSIPARAAQGWVLNSYVHIVEVVTVLAVLTIVALTFGSLAAPAVTLVVLMRGGLSGSEAAARIAVQVIGGLCGTILAHAMFSLPLWQAAATMRSGGSQWLAEGVATFGLVLSILGAQRAPGAPVAATVALYIAAAYWFTSSTSFANPAVTLARAFSDSFAGIRPVDVPAFVLAQLAGAGLAAGLAGWLFRSDAGTEGM